MVSELSLGCSTKAKIRGEDRRKIINPLQIITLLKSQEEVSDTIKDSYLN